MKKYMSNKKQIFFKLSFLSVAASLGLTACGVQEWFDSQNPITQYLYFFIILILFLLRGRKIFKDVALRKQLNALYDELKFHLSRQDIEGRVRVCRDGLELLNTAHLDDPARRVFFQENLAIPLLLKPYGKTDDIEEAISLLEEVVDYYVHVDDLDNQAKYAHNLGNSYFSRQYGERNDNLVKSRLYLEQALVIRKSRTSEAECANTHYSLGDVYRAIALEQAEGFSKAPEQSIFHYQEALRVYGPDNDPYKWGIMQLGLAAMYYLLRDKNQDNLERAIHYWQQALTVFTKYSSPSLWAGGQNNIGLAFNLRTKGDKADNIEQAIEYFLRALEIDTFEQYPKEWAETLINLANAYWRRVLGNPTENMRKSVDTCQTIIENINKDERPILWGTAQFMLGNALSGLIALESQGDVEKNIQLAIQHFEHALEVFTLEGSPGRWAGIHNNIGAIYSSFNREKDGLKRAVEHIQLALSVLSREKTPMQWALTIGGLAQAYSALAQSQETQYLPEADALFQQQLEIYTIDDFPHEHQTGQGNLGHLYFHLGEWEKALNAYEAALKAGEIAFKTSFSEEGRKSEMGKIATLYGNAAYCLLQLNQPEAALITLENGKTRLFSEAIALNDLDLGQLSNNDGQKIAEARNAVRVLESEVRLTYENPDRVVVRSLMENLRQARADLLKLIAATRERFPEFMPTGLDLQTLLENIPQDAALVVPLITYRGSAVFVVPGGTKEINGSHVITISSFNDKDLSAILTGTEAAPGWRLLYKEFQIAATENEIKNWQSSITDLTENLWKYILQPVHEQLTGRNIKRVILMPTSGLQLLPLHAAWRNKGGKKRYLLDDYEVTIIPSAYSMQICSQRAKACQEKSALIAGIGEYQNLPPLKYAEDEIANIAQQFNVPPIFNQAATKEYVKRNISGKAYVHFACHGSFAWQRNPLSAALYLAQDEALTLADIISLQIKDNRLVTLSACESGIVDTQQSPDEHIGLPVGFLWAGAASVVSSLWYVSDESTSLLMQRFYSNILKKKMSPPAAIREAQLWLRDKAGNGKYADPYYWAAFTYLGV